MLGTMSQKDLASLSTGNASGGGGAPTSWDQAISSPTYQSSAPATQLTGPQGGDYGYNAAVMGSGENFANAAVGYYGNGGMPSVSQNAQTAYGDFRSSTPANMDPYYDNASRKMQNTINTQMAARGSYGSSNAVGNIMAGETDLRAQQAKDEANYGLQRQQLGGSLASSADNSSMAASADERNWVSGLGDMAFRGQQMGKDRFQQNYANSMGFGDVMAGLEGDSYAAEHANDSSLMDNGLSAATGGVVQAHTGAVENQNQSDARGKAGFDAAMGIAKLGLGAAL